MFEQVTTLQFLPNDSPVNRYTVQVEGCTLQGSKGSLIDLVLVDSQEDTVGS